MVRVFITVDAEIWPNSPGWPQIPLSPEQECHDELCQYFRGGSAPDAPGIAYQLRTMAAAGLKATYFIEPLFSYALGLAPLREVVDLVQGYGQEVGLHLHPEWLTDPRCAPLPRFAGPLLSGYLARDQGALVAAGLARLHAAGATQVKAFRAGNWGANRSTLKALDACGIRYDSSLNGCFPVSYPDLPQWRGLTQPARLDGVWEFPVTTLVDRPPAGLRPLHVTAASFGEFRTVVEHAVAQQWFAVVIVLHSFEFVRVGRADLDNPAARQRLLARRFEKICAYLADHRDRLQPCHFADLDQVAIAEGLPGTVPRSRYTRTGWRMAQQLASRFY